VREAQARADDSGRDEADRARRVGYARPHSRRRHTAGQRVLDATGNLKAVQKLLGHAPIQTTGDIYTDWDVEQLAKSLMEAVEDDA
jgi:site-specific recombinase XerC